MPEAVLSLFTYAQDALDYAEQNRVDVAFLDIEMPKINSLAVAKRLKNIFPYTNIIFVTGYSKYALDAFDTHASGYVLKPIEPERVMAEMENLRKTLKKTDSDVYIHCFGNFEVFACGKPVSFSCEKSKEVLAYLVDRCGASVSKKDIAAVLFESDKYTRSLQSNIHILITEMISSLERVGASRMIIKQR